MPVDRKGAVKFQTKNSDFIIKKLYGAWAFITKRRLTESHIFNQGWKRTVTWQVAQTLKRSRFAASFREINRLDSAIFTLRWFKLPHICIQV